MFKRKDFSPKSKSHFQFVNKVNQNVKKLSEWKQKAQAFSIEFKKKVIPHTVTVYTVDTVSIDLSFELKIISFLKIIAEL